MYHNPDLNHTFLITITVLLFPFPDSLSRL